MLSDIVIVPVEMSNRDLIIVLQVAQKLGVSRNEAIRILIKKGFEKITQEVGKNDMGQS